MKVKALGTFKQFNIRPKELDYVPEEGTIFEVTRERYTVLSGVNPTNTVYVKLVEEDKKIETATLKKSVVAKKSSSNVKKRPLQK